MKKIFFSVLFCVGLLFMVNGVQAADYNLTCTYESGCSPSLSAFFPASEVWYPGKTLTKTVQFTNNSSIDRKVGVQATHTTVSGDIDQVIELVITKSDSTVLFSNSLHAFYAAGELTLLNNLSSHASETFSFKATMYTTSSNEYQNMTTTFDLIIGLISSPTPTPLPCTDAKPVSPRPLSLSRINDTEVKATWESASDPVTGYRISWSKDTDTDGDGDGTKSVGKTTETNITGLNLTSYTYYFKVRAINGCKEGDTTGIVTVGDGPNYLAPTSTPVPPSPTPVGFVPSPTPAPTAVLGISTSNLQSPQEEVRGATTQKCRHIWWQILLGELLVSALYYFRFAKNMSGKKPKIIGVLIAIMTLAIFKLLNRCSTYSFLILPNSQDVFFRYFVLVDILIVITFLLLQMRGQMQTEKNPEDLSLPK